MRDIIGVDYDDHWDDRLYPPDFKEANVNDIRVNKKELLDALKANREIHIAGFESAWEGFVEYVESVMQQRLEAAKDKIPPHDVSWTRVPGGVPQNHAADYDTAIRMLEMSLDDTIMVDHNTFERYVMDNWSWKGQHLASLRNYSK